MTPRAARAPLRCRAVAAATRLYPLKSGCGTFANSALIDRLAAPPATNVWMNIAGGEILAPLDDYIGRAMFFVGDLDRKVSWAVERCVSPGDTVLDVGANPGLISLLLAKCVGPTGRVHAFEPNPRMGAYLEASLARHPAAPVTLHPIALGSEESVLPLFLPAGRNAGAATLAPTHRAAAGTVEVPVRRLSDYAAEIGLESIDFMKIDVEGFEADMLLGAAEIFDARPPMAVLLEENAPAPPDRLPASLRFLQDRGYKLHALPKRLWSVDLVPIDHPDAAEAHDYVALAPGAAETVGKRLGAI